MIARVTHVDNRSHEWCEASGESEEVREVRGEVKGRGGESNPRGNRDSRPPESIRSKVFDSVAMSSSERARSDGCARARSHGRSMTSGASDRLDPRRSTAGPHAGHAVELGLGLRGRRLKSAVRCCEVEEGEQTQRRILGSAESLEGKPRLFTAERVSYFSTAPFSPPTHCSSLLSLSRAPRPTDACRRNMMEIDRGLAGYPTKRGRERKQENRGRRN